MCCSCRLPHVLLPVRHLREDRQHRRQGSHLLLRQRDTVLLSTVDGAGLPLLLLLPLQAAVAVRAHGGALRRLLRPLLLRGLRALPGVPRAQGPRLRHVRRMGPQHGEAECNRTARDESGDVALVLASVCMRQMQLCICHPCSVKVSETSL